VYPPRVALPDLWSGAVLLSRADKAVPAYSVARQQIKHVRVKPIPHPNSMYQFSDGFGKNPDRRMNKQINS